MLKNRRASGEVTDMNRDLGVLEEALLEQRVKLFDEGAMRGGRGRFSVGGGRRNRRSGFGSRMATHEQDRRRDTSRQERMASPSRALSRPSVWRGRHGFKLRSSLKISTFRHRIAS